MELVLSFSYCISIEIVVIFSTIVVVYTIQWLLVHPSPNDEYFTHTEQGKYVRAYYFRNRNEFNNYTIMR